MSNATKIAYVVLWWGFMAVTFFGMLLSNFQPGTAVVALGCGGLFFTLAAFVLELRDAQ